MEKKIESLPGIGLIISILSIITLLFIIIMNFDNKFTDFLSKNLIWIILILIIISILFTLNCAGSVQFDLKYDHTNNGVIRPGNIVFVNGEIKRPFKGLSEQIMIDSENVCRELGFTVFNIDIINKNNTKNAIITDYNIVYYID